MSGSLLNTGSLCSKILILEDKSFRSSKKSLSCSLIPLTGIKNVVILSHKPEARNLDILFSDYFNDEKIQSFEYNWFNTTRDLIDALHTEGPKLEKEFLIENLSKIEYLKIKEIDTFLSKIEENDKSVVICLGSKNLIDDVEKMIPKL